MRFWFTASQWLALLVAAGVGGCQRANYQLQPIAKTVCQPLPYAPALESAVVRIAAPPATQFIESHRELQRHPRQLAKSPLSVRMKTPLVVVRPPTTAARVATRAARLPQEPGPVTKPVRYRSRGIAILLAALSLTYLPLSLHNFYLGYYGRGALAIALVVIGTYLVVLSFLGSLFSGTGLVGLGLIGLAMLGGWFVWQVIDLVRIITKDLKPKNGEYNPQLFQTSPDAGSTSLPRTD